MSKKNAIMDGVKTAQKYGFTPAETLNAELTNIENPLYRVAVVGKFQVGKSTLINHVFLGDNPILLEGSGLCTTSVTTEVGYGPTPRLEVYHWNDASKIADSMAQALDNPTQDELKSVTVGEDRVALADKISKVKFFTPNENLKQYILLDTPGIDDPNPDILQNTTYRVIPGSDLAIVVIGARQLDQVELELLRKDLIKDGIARLMVLISYRPEDSMTAEKRAQIIATVKAQLANIGKEAIPVEMYCFNEAVDDILCTVSEISLKINSFLAENALAGREDHVATHVREFLTNCLLEVATQLKTSGQNAAQNEELKKKFAEQSKEIKIKCDMLLDSLKREFDAVKRNSHGLVENKVRSVFADFKEKLQQADLTSIRNMLENADESLKLKLSDAIDDCARKIEENVRNVLKAKVPEMQNIAMTWDNFLQGELGVDGGIMTKIPSIVLELGNVIILNILLPGGFIIAIIGRMLQSILPILKDLSLQKLLKTILLRKANSALDEALPKVVENICTQIGNNLDDAAKQAGEAIRAKFAEQSQAVMGNLDTAPTVDKAELDAAKAEIQKAIDALN